MSEYKAKEYRFEIPIKPKAVQSTRFNGRFTYVDPKVRKWKDAVSQWVTIQKPELPSKMPFEVVRAVYTFKLPDTTTKKAMKVIEAEWAAGRDVAYISTPDLTDNINKGITDVITACGILEDDKQIWRVAPNAEIKKVYGKVDSIQITIRETPDVILKNGKTALETYGS